MHVWHRLDEPRQFVTPAESHGAAVCSHQRLHIIEVPVPRHVKQGLLSLDCKAYQFTGSSIIPVGRPRFSGFIHVSAFAL